MFVAERYIRSMTPDWMLNIPRRITSYVASLVYSIIVFVQGDPKSMLQVS